MNKNRHDPELIDEKSDIYKCTKCGKTGKFKIDFYDDCTSEDTTEPKTPGDGSLLRGIINTELNSLF